MRPLTATAPQLDEEPSCSSSSSSAFRLPPAPMMRREQRCASLSAPALGDLASRLDGLSHPDVERIAANGVRLSPTKYARPAWMISRGDPRAERGAGRPNVEVPFASEPGALREFLWGLIHGFGDLAAIVKGAVTCDRTVLDKLPYRDQASPRPGGAVDPEKLEGILDAQARGLFCERGRAAASANAEATLRSPPAPAATPEQPTGSSPSFWGRRWSLLPLPLPPSSAAVSTWSLPGEAEAEAQRHRLAPGARRESAGEGLALIAALNVALLYAGSRAPTG